MIRERSDLNFYFITKRPERFTEVLPDDWGEGYDNVRVCCTCENQEMTDKRLPVFLDLPIKHKEIIHEPMLEPISINRYLELYPGKIECISCGGESGDNARILKYEWVLNTRAQCIQHNVSFSFHQTGSYFEKDDRIYHIERKYQESQAAKAGIDAIFD